MPRKPELPPRLVLLMCSAPVATPTPTPTPCGTEVIFRTGVCPGTPSIVCAPDSPDCDGNGTCLGDGGDDGRAGEIGETYPPATPLADDTSEELDLVMGARTPRTRADLFSLAFSTPSG